MILYSSGKSRQTLRHTFAQRKKHSGSGEEGFKFLLLEFDGFYRKIICAMLKFNTDTGKPMTHHDDAVKVAPDSYKVVLENDAVRVLEVRIKQGTKSEMHSHPKSVAICINDQRLRFTFPNGKTEDADLKRGQAVWLDGISHAVENTGTEDVSSVVVELKK
jgi:quercetin dioxygenase-like cupin family protein